MLLFFVYMFRPFGAGVQGTRIGVGRFHFQVSRVLSFMSPSPSPNPTHLMTWNSERPIILKVAFIICTIYVTSQKIYGHKIDFFLCENSAVGAVLIITQNWIDRKIQDWIEQTLFASLQILLFHLFHNQSRTTNYLCTSVI